MRLKPIGRLLVWLSAAVLVLFFLTLAASMLALTSQYGLRTTVRILTAFSDGHFSVGAVQGSLAASQWQDLEYSDRTGLRIRVKAITLHAVSRDVLRQRLHVALMEVEGLEVNLPVSAPRGPRASPLDLPSRLPFDVIVDSLVLTDARLKQGEVEVLVVERAALAAQWLGEELEVLRLQSGFKRTGPLEFRAKAHMHGDQIDLRDLWLQGPGELTAQGTLGLEKSPSDLKLTWRGARWPLVTEGVPPGIADVAGEATVKGPLDDYRFEISAAAVVQKVPARLSARGGGSLRDLSIEHLQLIADQGSAELHGALAWAPALRADLAGKVSKLNPALFAPDWPGLIDGSLKTQTTMRDGEPQVAFELRIDPSKLRGQAFAATARGSTNIRSASFEQLTVTTGGGSLTAKGDVAWQPALAANVDANLAQLDPGVLFPGWPGKLSGTAQVRTLAATQPPDLRFSVDIEHSQLRGYPLTATAHGNWRAPELHLDDLDIRSGETHLTASGRATSPFDLTAHLQSPDLVALHPDLGGAVRADLTLQGPLDQPHLVAKATGTGLRWRGYRAGKLDVDADVDPRVPSHFTVSLVDGNFGVVVPQATLSAKGIERYHYVVFDGKSERGDLAFAAEGGYDRKRQEWGGYLTSTRVAPKDLPDWKLEKSTPMLLGRKRQSVEPACMSGGAGRGCVRLEQNVTGQGLRLYVDLEDLQLAAFQPLLSSDTRLEGHADGDGYIEIAGADVAAIQAEVRLNGVRIIRPGLPPFQMQPSRIKADQQNGRLHAVADFKLDQGSIAADVAAEPGATFRERPLSGQIRVDVPDLSFIQHFSSQLRAVSGKAGGTLQLGGTPALPRLRGEIVLADGRARLVTPGITIEQVQLRLSGNGDGPLALSGSMRSGEGSLAVSGDVDPARAPPRANVSVKGENFQAVATPDARIWITPDLRLASDDTGVHLEGSLTVPRAEITPRKGIGDQGVAVSADQIMVGAEPAPPNAALKVYSTVKVALGEQVSFKGFGLTTQLSGSVTIFEEPLRETSAQGSLYLNNGRYKAYGQDLNIESGRLIFDGGPVNKPAVDLYATRHPQSDVTVGVRVRGTLNRPELRLQSDPPMPREEQLSWLVLGRPLDASSSSDRSALTQAALSLGLSGGDYLAQRLGKGVGLDTLTIGGPTASGSGVAADAGTIQGSQASMSRGAYQDQTQAAQLTLGKYLTPKLFVSYGVSLFQPGQTFRLLYDLGRGFKLQTESGVANGADLIYTFERGK